MPTYYATGVTATLASCDLRSTLSASLCSLKQGAEYQCDVSRIQRAFATAEKFSERPLNDVSVIDFIGVDQDMPFYIVEAKKQASKTGAGVDDIETQDTWEEVGMALTERQPFPSDDSPLTSLATTPTPTRQVFDNSPLKKWRLVLPTSQEIDALAVDPTLVDRVQGARVPLESSNAQALVLDVQLSDKSFLPEEKTMTRGGMQMVGKDLKIEVFINGQLADVTIIHSNEKRRHAVQVDGDKVRFTGTRIHRQVEKPWVYLQEALNPEIPTDVGDAEARWNVVCKAHVAEAELRGRDHLGDPSPSSQFLKALAGLQFPRQGSESLGIVDIVITVGRGKKHGPETLYLTKPTRMDDRRYSTQGHSITNAVMHSTPPLQRTYVPECATASSSIEPIRESILTTSDIKSSKTKILADLTKELNLKVDPAKTIIGTFETSRGMTGTAGRTLRQRLGDLKKMNSANFETESAKLKDQFGAAKQPPQKIQKLNSGSGSNLTVYGAGTVADDQRLVEATNLSELCSSPAPAGADPEAVPFQNQTDTVFHDAAPSNTTPSRKVATTSPQQTPPRKTQASSLAGSATITSVKMSPRKIVPHDTPKRGKADIGELSISNVEAAGSAKGQASPSRSINKVNDTSQKAKPPQHAVTQALKAFKIPAHFQGSCVSYVEDESVFRQIGKARGGEFKEEAVLVGMRFVVV